MAGLLTNGVPNLVLPTGSELFPLDTESAGGASPQSASISLASLAAAITLYSNNVDVTGIAGRRFSVQVPIGSAKTITGVSVLVGSTGGTDKWLVELHNSAGVLVATSALAGATAGTAGTFQQIAFTAPYAAAAGTYYATLQMNGATAKFKAYNAPTFPYYTQSAAGTFGTSASITPPTSYTAAVGPVAVLY